MPPESDASEANQRQPIVLQVGPEDAGQRLDAFLAHRLLQFSRTHLRRLIDAGQVTVDGDRVKVAYRLVAGQTVHVAPGEPPRTGPQPEPIPLDVLYEDAHLAAINKPPGMVVHPARGHWAGTLASAVAHHFQSLSGIGGPTRPGIVHRLDRDTSGVIVIAKTDQAHLSLAQQFEQRQVKKEYFAIVAGLPDHDRDYIEQPIGAHPYQREKMAIRHNDESARHARTFYEVLERFPRFATLRVLPETGRTHQIRLHLAHIGCPVLCDRLYGGRSQITVGEIEGSADSTVVLDRQALHASRLELTHPDSGKPMRFEAPLAEDLESVVRLLRTG